MPTATFTRINPQQIINSRFGVSLASFLGRAIPPKLGYRIADFIADWIVSHKDWDMVQAVGANQWVVSGETLAGVALDQAVQGVFRNIARSIYNLSHYTQNIEPGSKLSLLHPPAFSTDLIVHNAAALAVVQRPEFAGQGLVVTGLHCSNFDFILQMGGLFGMHALVLTLPELAGSYQAQYELRKKAGLNLVPTSVNVLRQAVDYLRKGGLVITGIDYPTPASGYQPRFFGRPAALPAHPIYLALKAQVPIKVMLVTQQPDGKYCVLSSEPIEMQPHPDRHAEILINAESVCKIAEGFIRLAPQQWSLTRPVWPEALNQVPSGA